MDKINIEGVIVTPLKKVSHPKGDIYHGIKRSDKGFVDFGEAYFSTIKYAEIKGWNRHKKATLNLVVPVGAIVFVAYDDREKSSTKGDFLSVEISVDTYQRLTVPPGVWLAFKGIDEGTNLILDVIDMEHDPDEVEKCNLEEFPYNWSEF